MGTSHHAPARDGGIAAARTTAPGAGSTTFAPDVDGPLRVDVIDDVNDLAALAEPWAELVRSTPDATAYQSPAFLLPWYRYFERPGGIHVVAVWRGERLVGLAPFARTRLGVGPAAVSLLVSAGTEHGDYGDPLLGPDPGPVADAIADHLAGLVHRRVVVNARRLRDDGHMVAALEARDDLARAPMGQVAEAAVVRFEQLDDPAAHLQRLAAKHDVPRRMRRLTEAHGDVTYTAADPDVDAALDTMHDMLARRWPAGEGPAIFRGARRAAFTREAAHALSGSGFGRMAVLRAGEMPVAVILVLAVGDRIITDNTAVEPDLGRFGPGQAAIHRLLTHALDDGVREVDMRAGDFPYKYRWTNATHRTRSLVLTAPGSQGQAMTAARRVLMSRRARRLARLAALPPRAAGPHL